MTSPKRTSRIDVALVRDGGMPISVQIADSIRLAILEGRLRPGSRLPSWIEMASHLGVSRGTVKAAYERLLDEDLVFTAGAAGTRVVNRLIAPRAKLPAQAQPLQALDGCHDMATAFDPDCPGVDQFPRTAWARLASRIAKRPYGAFPPRGDARGSIELREQVVAHLALTRSNRCSVEQVFITAGYGAGLALTLFGLQPRGSKVATSHPLCPTTQRVLAAAKVEASHGLLSAADWTPGSAMLVQSTPSPATGRGLSPSDLAEIVRHADSNEGWIIEDDRWGNLQLTGRAAPSIARGSARRNTVSIGCFGLTLSPTVQLGYVVVPSRLADRFLQLSDSMFPPPSLPTQLALADFMASGQYLRHLRQLKNCYRRREAKMLELLAPLNVQGGGPGATAVVNLADDVDDIALSNELRSMGLMPAPLSLWNQGDRTSKGLLLSATNLGDRIARSACEKLLQASSLMVASKQKPLRVAA